MIKVLNLAIRCQKVNRQYLMCFFRLFQKITSNYLFGFQSFQKMISDLENIDEEVKELLQNYKFKKATTYEPCTIKNFKECLIGLSEVRLLKILI